MVESQLRHFVQGKPSRISSVISTLHLLHPHQGIVGNGDDTLTRVTLWRSECMELTDVCTLQTCLFLQFTQRTLLSTFVHLHESTRKSPSPFERFDASLHQKHSQFCTVKPKDDTVRRYTRMGVLIAVFQLFVCLVNLIHIPFALKLRHKGNVFILNDKIFCVKNTQEKRFPFKNTTIYCLFSSFFLAAHANIDYNICIFLRRIMVIPSLLGHQINFAWKLQPTAGRVVYRGYTAPHPEVFSSCWCLPPQPIKVMKAMIAYNCTNLKIFLVKIDANLKITAAQLQSCLIDSTFLSNICLLE